MITKFYNYINETLTDKIYHFTYLSNAYFILSDNKFNLSPIFGTKADLDINSGKLYAFSLTSSRGSDIGFASSLSKKGLVRITLDGRKLNQNYKSKRVDYWKNPKDPKDPMYQGTYGKALYKNISRQDELEDRIISDKDSIPNAAKYILSIDILYNEENDNWKESREQLSRYIGLIKGLCDKYDIPFNLYDDNEYFDANYTTKTIDVEPIEMDFNEDSDREFYFNDIASFLILKDDKQKEKVFKYIDDNLENPEKVKENIQRKANNIEYDMKFYADWQIQEKGSVLNSYIHNNKSNRNNQARYIINQIGLDMKKNKCTTTTDYIEYKMWKGKKKVEDFKKELIDKANKEIDKIFNNYKKDYLNFRYYDIDGYGHDDFSKDKKFNVFMKKKINELKNYYSDITYNSTGVNFEYTYEYGNSNVKSGLNIIIDEYDEFVNKNYENINGNELVNIIYHIINEMYDFFSDEIENIKNEQYKQWNT